MWHPAQTDGWHAWPPGPGRIGLPGAPLPSATWTPGEATRPGPQREPVWVMGVPVGALGGQKDARGLRAELRSARCLPRPGQSVYPVPPARFPGTPRCSGRSLDTPRLRRGKLRLRWGHSSREHGCEPCCRTKKQGPSCTPRSSLPPSAAPSAGRGSPDRRKPSGRARLPSLRPPGPGRPARTPDPRRQDRALSRRASQGQRGGRTERPAGWARAPAA